MMDMLTSWAVSLGDLCFGWLLWVPRGVAITLLSAITATLSYAIRYACDVGHLTSFAKRDLKQLRQLKRQARESGDLARLDRLRRNRASVLAVLCRHELLVLLVALVPLVLIVTWADERLSRLPQRPNQPVAVHLLTPLSDVGSLTHLVPTDALAIDGGCVRRIETTSVDDLPGGMAVWKVATDSQEPIPLVIRLGERTFIHELVVGPKMSPAVVRHESRCVTTIAHEKYAPWNLPLPGDAWLHLYLATSMMFFVLLGLCSRWIRRGRADVQMG